TSADASARPELSRLFESPVVDVPLTHEGGNILCNGEGICLTSTTVLLKNASRQYDARKIGEVLGEYFGATQWAYLDPLSGEPTGHIDLFCSFLSRDMVLVGQFDPKADSINAGLLDRAAEILASLKTPRGNLRVERIQLPPPVDGKYRSYTNAIIANGAVIVPLFPDINDSLDQKALAKYKELLPDYDVIGIDILDLSSLGGGLHCLTSHVCLPRRGMMSGGLPELSPADQLPVDFVGVRRG
ncbi:MAG: agmatine deiminase family protein, partial [Verrucomicrobiae bacterium]|nr:agmatine deiminase family protein [Verrucomicrobiae bacterium]